LLAQRRECQTIGGLRVRNRGQVAGLAQTADFQTPTTGAHKVDKDHAAGADEVKERLDVAKVSEAVLDLFRLGVVLARGRTEKGSRELQMPGRSTASYLCALTRSHFSADGQWDGHAIGNSQRYCG
jgi:hypothetical protein